jgi:hypothetical protein
MKKIGLLIAVLVLVAFATEVSSWHWDGSAWVDNGKGPTALARCWGQLDAAGNCNKKDWVVPVTIKASMAQWIEWSINATEWKWRIRKVGPNLCQTDGYYAADCITFNLKSNYDVTVDFDGFADLERVEAGGVDRYIEVWYALGDFWGGNPPPLTSAEWVSAADLNNLTLTAEDSQELHDGIFYKLWNKIHVTSCNSACEYQDDATVTISLTCIKSWIDPLTGYFNL